MELAHKLALLQGVGPYPIVLIDDFSTLSDWPKTSGGGDTSGTISTDGSDIRFARTTLLNSFLAATKTFSPGVDLSRGGVLLLKLKNGNSNVHTSARAEIYLSSNNFGKFLNFWSDRFLSRGATQYVAFDLASFVVTGGESIANPMTQIRVRLHSLGADTAITFDKLIYIPSPGKDRPRVVLSFDDGWASQYSIAYPYMVSKGLAGTLYIIKNLVGGGSYMSLAQIQELYAAGWDVGNHTDDHVEMTEATVAGICASQSKGSAGALTINGSLASGGQVVLDAPRHISFYSASAGGQNYITVTGELSGQAKSEIVNGSPLSGNALATEGLFDKVTGVSIAANSNGNISVGTARTQAEAQAAIANCKTYLDSNGMSRASAHFAYPNGASTPSSDLAMAAAGMLTGRGTAATYMPAMFGVPSAVLMPALGKTTLAAMKVYIDTAISLGLTAHVYLHKLDPSTDDSLTITTANFQAFIDYIAAKRDAGLIDPLTITQWYSAVTSRARTI